METSLTKIRKAVKNEASLNRKLFAVINIILAAGAVFFGISSEIDVIDRTSKTICYFMPNGGAIAVFGIGIACGLIAVIAVFKELYSKQNADIQFSLPLSAKERYISKIGAVFRLHILPIIFWGLIALGILCIKNHDNITGEIVGQIVIIIFIAVSVALFVDAVSVFCISCCGALAESFYTSVLAMFALSLTPELFFETILDKYSGIYSQGISHSLGTWTVLSIQFIGNKFSAALAVRLIINCLISCAVLALAYFIYRKRDGQTTGKPIVFKLLFEFLLLLEVFCCFMVFLFDKGRWIFILITFIAYLIIRIISTRAKITFKKLMFWIGAFASYLLCYTVISAAAYYTDGFGYYSDFTENDIMDYNYCYVNIYQGGDYVYTELGSFCNNSASISKEQAIELYNVFRELKNTQEKSLSDCMRKIFFDNEVDTNTFSCAIDSFEGKTGDAFDEYVTGQKHFTFDCSANTEELDKAMKKIEAFDFWEDVNDINIEDQKPSYSE